jgi:lysophospholipase L1-like esterase
MDRRKLLTAGLALAGGAAAAGTARAQAQSAQSSSSSPDTSPATPPQASDAAARAGQANQPMPAAPPAPPKVANFDWPNLKRYHQANAEAMALPASARRVVMMGDSITDNWANPQFNNGDFFGAHGIIGRGISGQVTAQMLVRFTPEVIALKPQVVHIMAGTNDIAENQDPYDFAAATGNLQAMITLAKANGIRVVMASVPPATSFSWKPYRGNQLETIKALNAWIKAACAEQRLTWCDYWPVLQGPDGGLRPDLGYHGDSVHPGPAGYAVMEPVLLEAIRVAQTRPV